MAIYPRVVYKITHNVTKRAYIGTSGKFETRIKLHFNALRSGRHSVEDMQNDFDNYGDNFTVEIVDIIHNMSEVRKEYDLILACHTHIRGVGYNYKDNHGGLKKEVSNVYPNLRAEIARRGLTLENLCEKLNVTICTLSQKLNGKSPITLDEAKKLKKAVGTDLPLEILFSKEAIQS